MEERPVNAGLGESALDYTPATMAYVAIKQELGAFHVSDPAAAIIAGIVTSPPGAMPKSKGWSSALREGDTGS